MTWKKGDDGKYVRTVRCSYCYELGHNRSTCPELKKYIDKLRKENGDHTYSVAEYDRMKKKRSNRSCSYCKEKGHNTRSCPTLKKDVDTEYNINKVYRARVYEHIKSIGLGIGALVKVNHYMTKGYQREEVLGFVEQIIWDRIRSTTNGYGWRSPHAFVTSMQKENYTGDRKEVLNVPFHPETHGNYSYDNERYEVVNPSDHINPPPGWFELEDIPDLDKELAHSLKSEGRYFVTARHREFEARHVSEKE